MTAIGQISRFHSISVAKRNAGVKSLSTAPRSAGALSSSYKLRGKARGKESRTPILNSHLFPRHLRAIYDDHQGGLIKQFWLESGCGYGYRMVHGDVREIGEACGKNRALRLMSLNGLRAQRSYKRHKVATVARWALLLRIS